MHYVWSPISIFSSDVLVSNAHSEWLVYTHFWTDRATSGVTKRPIRQRLFTVIFNLFCCLIFTRCSRVSPSLNLLCYPLHLVLMKPEVKVTFFGLVVSRLRCGIIWTPPELNRYRTLSNLFNICIDPASILKS
jgi:hypothetical protein